MGKNQTSLVLSNQTLETKMSISDAAMADCILPTDVMLNILTRLPAKSIQRFKFVSKLWSEFLSSPEFIEMYKGQFSIDPNNQSFIIFEHNRIEYGKRVVNLINIDSTDSPKMSSILDLPHSEVPGDMLVLIGCCNGLICVVEYGPDIIFLWNPAMEMFQRVSLSEDGLYCDAENYFESLGFGYDAGGDDFKLVRIVSEFDDNITVTIGVHSVEVYSVNSDVWTTIDVNLNFGVQKGYSVVTVNGNPYWPAYTDEEAYYNDEEDVLVYFDVKLLAFKIIPMPPSYVHSRWKYKGFVDWNGTVGYLECDRGSTESYAKVWVFEDGWRCKETIGPIKGFIDSFVTCSRNGNIFWYEDYKCFLYDRRSNCVKEIMTVEHYYFIICGYTANFERTLKNSLPQILNVPLRNS